MPHASPAYLSLVITAAAEGCTQMALGKSKHERQAEGRQGWGCNMLVWGLVLAPLALTALLFVVSFRLGLLAMGTIVVAAGLYLGAAYLATKARERCPGCRAKKLKCVNWFRANPPPNYGFYRCEACAGEYVKIDGQPGFIERGSSECKDADGWNAAR